MDYDRLKPYAEAIFNELGIVYSERNSYQLEGRLEEISKALGYKSIEELETRSLATDQELRDLLFDKSTNNETLFFRDRGVFDGFSKLVLPEFHKRVNGAKPMRIWSAACSTGQEPYSVAFCCEAFKKENPNFRYEILATDYSQRVLRQAKDGLFQQIEVQRGLSSIELIQYFSKVEDGDATSGLWEIKPEFKAGIKFNNMNLLKEFRFPHKFDFILCRNVLIYQTPENKRKIVLKLLNVMDENSRLILGGAESLLDMSDEVKQEVIDKVIYFTRKPLNSQESA